MNPVGVALFCLVSLTTWLSVCQGGQAMSLEVCQSMIPEQETSQPQTKIAPPYRLNVSDSCFQTGRSLQVTLAGLNGSVFQGFIVQARKPNDDKFSFGKFNNGGDQKIETIDCFNQSANAIGHLNETGYNFTRATFEWTAPADVSLDVIEFVATVVLKYNTFWVGLQAQITRCNDNRDNNTSLSGNNDTTSESTMTTANNATTTANNATTTATTTTATTTVVIGNSTTSATNGTVHTSLSTATAAATSIGENVTVSAATATSTSENNTVAMTTASMMNETTSGADRRKYSMLSTAAASSVAFVACLASVRLTY